jgi:hypothetical protein
MLFEDLVSRLRAAHALSFAMATGQKPDQTDLAAVGLGGVSTDFFDARVDGGEQRRRKQPVAAGDATLEPARWNPESATEAA